MTSLNTSTKCRNEIGSIQRQIEYYERHGIATEVESKKSSLVHWQAELVKAEAAITPAAIAERNVKTAATKAQIEALLKTASPEMAEMLRQTLKALK